MRGTRRERRKDSGVINGIDADAVHGMRALQRATGPARTTVTAMVAVIAAVAAAVVFSSSASAFFQNEPDGFRGIIWGSSVKDLPGAEFLAKEGDQQFYTLKGEKLTIADARIDKIVYGFYKDRLFNVMVYYTGLPNFMKIKEVLMQQYGIPDQPNQYIDKYFWDGSKVDIFANYDDISKEGRIAYFFKPLAGEMEEAERTEAGKAGKDL